MNWKKLKNYECPKCNSPLKATETHHVCIDCDFAISKQKFDEIVKSQHKPKSTFMSEEERMSAWNNDGHEIVSKSFL